MDKYIKHSHALAALSVLLLIYFATHTQCRIMEDVDNKKINLPDGLCTHHARGTCSKGYCFCCFLNNLCYATMDECKKESARSCQFVLVAGSCPHDQDGDRLAQPKNLAEPKANLPRTHTSTPAALYTPQPVLLLPSVALHQRRLHAALRRWEELPPELLYPIGESLDLKCYTSARGACTAWRCALAPPSPSLLLVPDDATCCPSAASLSTNRVFELRAIPSGLGPQCVVSCSNGWLALDTGHGIFSLFNPITGSEIVLLPLIYSSRWVSNTKLVFAPNPASDDFAAVAICDNDRLAYITAGARRWAILDPVRLAIGDHLTDVVYHEIKGSGKVYCLTSYGDVHVLHLPERRRREAFVDDKPSSLRQIPIIHRRQLSAPALRADEYHRRWTEQQQCAMIVHKRSIGPDLNVPATVQPLLSLPFDRATSFAPPYNTIYGYISAKNLVFCEGHLYQIWRNTSCALTVGLLSGGGRCWVAEDQMFVLRYYPDRTPCWDAVTDLGGYSVFLGKNNAVSMSHAEGVLGLKGNCVYWIGGRGRDHDMVFDMATGSSKACILPVAAAGISPQSTLCGYFLSDMVNNCNNNGE